MTDWIGVDVDQRTCAWDGCNRVDILARGLCHRCYKRASRSGATASFSVTVRACDICGTQFAAGKHGKRYCAQACRDVGFALRLSDLRSARAGAKVGRSCVQCGNMVPVAARADALYCSTDCQQTSWYQGNAERLRVAARAWAKSNPDARNDSDHRRRARKMNRDEERVNRVDVWIRDGGRCGLCSKDVDPDLRHPDPMSGSLDHVVPLARGGSHTLDNVQLTHLVCNLQKGTKVLVAGQKVVI